MHRGRIRGRVSGIVVPVNMAARQVRDNRRSRGGSGGFGDHQWVTLLVPMILVVLVLGLLLPASMTSPYVALVVAGLLLVVILAGVVGAQNASTVMLVLAFGFAPTTSFAIGPPPFVFATAFLAIAFLLVLPRLIHEPLRLPLPFTLGAVLFIVMGLASLPLAIDSMISFTYLAIAVLGLVLIPVMVVWMKPTDRQIYAMLVAFGIGVAVSTLVGIPRHEFRNRGLTYHPVALAYTATLALSFVPFLLSSKVRSRWLVALPLAGVALVAVWTSGSRTGLLVLAVLVLLVPLMARSIMLGAVVMSGAVVMVPRLIAYGRAADPSSALARLLGRGSAAGSDDARLFGLHEALNQIRRNPVLGNGYSTEHTYIVHNIYLQAFAAEGIIGLIGLLMMFAALILGLRSTNQRVRFLAYPALTAILSGPFQPNMGDHYLGLSLGLSLLAAMRALDERRDPDPPDEAESASRVPGALSRSSGP